ncbi:TetR family transcriptional regulator [Streptosporangium carneum]|uniref:TetR family transcriptional regulator n=1 Tax=Streptosporangium carneum TaxID=47481 RepID=A0A9W6I7D7_9ACTN|nr:TetR family transcriptional regulator [Streptosporangium carneum]GLK13087.1 TetR family transcriptional regulator [Streptosporangium carneum]
MEGLRDRTRRAVRAELASRALELFAERGFDETTVDDIAGAAGMSKRSFFRYFSTKEDALFGELETMGEQVAQEISARPPQEGPWECLHAVLRTWEARINAQVDVTRLVESTPALRTRLLHKRDEARTHIIRALTDRGVSQLEADLAAAAAGAALDTVAREWLRADGSTDRLALTDRVFAMLRPAFLS